MDSRAIRATTDDRQRPRRIGPWRARGWWLIVVSSISLACSVDERTLDPGAVAERDVPPPTVAAPGLGPVTGPSETGSWWTPRTVTSAAALAAGPATSGPLAKDSQDSRDRSLSGERSQAQLNGGGRATRRDGARSELRLPWSAGETWYLTSGPHERSRAALDFAPPNLDPKTQRPYADACSRERSERYWVRAVARGRVASVLRRGCPLVEIEHEDGTASNYFHLEPSSVKATGLKVGSSVAAGQILGHPSCESGPPACGASQPATGVHVHFYRTVAKTRKRLPAHGLILSGWRVRAVGKMREGILVSGEDRRSTVGIAVGRTCPPGHAACRGQRNDLESDNSAPLSETALAVGVSWRPATSVAR